MRPESYPATCVANREGFTATVCQRVHVIRGFAETPDKALDRALGLARGATQRHTTTLARRPD